MDPPTRIGRVTGLCCYVIVVGAAATVVGVNAVPVAAANDIIHTVAAVNYIIHITREYPCC